MRVAILILVAACSSHATKPTHEETPRARGSAAPADAAPAIDAPRIPPKVDTACKETTDCTLTSETFEDDAPNTYACCSGCGQTAVSRVSYEQFQKWCQANRPPMCPPLGCAMPQMRASCEAGHCVAKDNRSAPPKTAP
jgi:hypothetical protein